MDDAKPNAVPNTITNIVDEPGTDLVASHLADRIADSESHPVADTKPDPKPHAYLDPIADTKPNAVADPTADPVPDPVPVPDLVANVDFDFNDGYFRPHAVPHHTIINLARQRRHDTVNHVSPHRVSVRAPVQVPDLERT